MSGEALTVAEAVPLGTVYLQRLLGRAGVRSLAIKGPAFVALGVRSPRPSNDIDLIIHQDDRPQATQALTDAGWSTISYWFPPALDDVIYSTTLRHSSFPVTLDLHHRFSGLLAGAAAFDALWEDRSRVEVAGQQVVTVGREHALIIESLNATKRVEADRRKNVSEGVLAHAGDVDVDTVIDAASRVGARHTVAPMIEALGGPPPSGPAPAGHERWVSRGSRTGGIELLVDLAVRAPAHLPRVLWQQLTLDSEIARFWAYAHHVEYQSRWQILWLRIRRAVRG